MDRRTSRFVGAILLVTAAALGLTSVANAGQVRARGSLLGAGRQMTVRDCSLDFEADAVAVPSADRFDPGSTVLVSASDPDGLGSGGGETSVGAGALVRIHVPAHTAPGTHRVEVKAAGTRDGLPAEVIDELTVDVRC
jgi:hypothetical protein